MNLISSDVVVGDAKITEVREKNYSVTINLRNPSGGRTIMLSFGPSRVSRPDGGVEVLGVPGVAMQVLLDHEWIGVHRSIALGMGWPDRIRLGPGDGITFEVEFGIDEDAQQLLARDLPMAVRLWSSAVAGEDVSIEGEILVPLARGGSLK
jgi:hypothetical protein